ncbi:MAG: DegQ family serine endoprotease [Gammaproteobacteria bacterium]
MSKCRFMLVLALTAMIGVPVHAQQGGIENLRQTSKAFSAIARQVSPSVVFIQAESTREGAVVRPSPSPFGEEWPFGEDLFKRFFGDEFPGIPRRETPQGQRHAVSQGSGFVFAMEGRSLPDKTYILTNNHVVEGADKIRVQFNDGRELNAKVKGTDPKSDIAVIEIDTGGLPALPLGDSSTLEVGEWVVAFGNPFGLSDTLTVGVVSAKGRTTLGISDYEDFIQTDAAINPGNSGGPLVNLSGKVVGINTAIFSRSGGYMGVGFAIPVNLAKGVANQLIERGEVTRGYLGIVIQPLTSDLAQSFGIEDQQGILIAQVTEDSPAAKAGLKVGDIVVGYQGKPVTEVGNFRNRVALTPPDSQEQLTIVRAGQRRDVTVRIGKLSEEKVVAQGSAQGEGKLGLTVQTLTPELARQFDAKPGEGVVVTDVAAGSIAAMAGIRRGAVILEVDRKAVNSAAEFKQALDKSAGDKKVLLLISENEMSRYVVLSWG